MKSTERIESIERQTFRLLVCALGLLLAFALAKGGPPAAFADEQIVLTYTLNDAGTEAAITKCLTTATDKQVADAFDEICTGGAVSIVAIGSNAFGNCVNLTEIDLPPDITIIDYRAFSGCTELRNIVIPSSVTSIGSQAFLGCTGLTNITVPGSVTSIGGQAFSGCTGLTEIELLPGVKSIGSSAFNNCTGLTSVVIPSSVTKIESEAFKGCTGLTSVSVDSANNIYSSDGGVLFNKAGTQIIQYPIGSAQISYTVSDGVTSIEKSAFYGCVNLKEIELPDGLTSIGAYAFEGCTGLTSVIIPVGVTIIDYGAFNGCTGLTNITIPDTVERIRTYAFRNCAGLTSLTVPSSVTNIESQVFEGCTGLISISVDEGNPVYSSKGGALSDGTQVIYFPPKSAQTSYIIPDGTVSIATGAFTGCANLTEIELPDGLISIENGAFASCSGLTYVAIPDTVTSIGSYAFNSCTKLTEIGLPSGLTDIGGNAFDKCISLKNIVIPSGVANIGSIFQDCAGLETVVISDGVTNIGNFAFGNCGKLSDITIPDSVTSIGDSAFSNCRSLTEIKLPNGLTTLGYSIFGNSRIEKISVPASVSTVGLSNERGPFNGMSYLSEIKLEHGMESFPAGILSGSLSNNPDIYVPMSIASGADAAGFDSLSDPVIHGVKGTYIIEWAKSKGLRYEEVDGEIKDPDIEHAWLNVPYQYIIETGTYENVGLNFNVVGGTLPIGLELLPDGRFHGAPLETGKFTFVVEVRYPVFDYLLDIQSIELTVEEPVGYPGDIELFESNDYPISDFIGESTGDVGGVPVGYVLTLLRSDEDDRIFRVADTDINDDGLIDAADSNFPYFTDFWLDGEKLTSASAISGGDYGAHEGSTVVTVYAKTFQNLENGNHTIAAEFMIPTREGDPPIQKVAAQKFTLELIDPEPEPEPEQKPEPDPEPGPEQKPDTEPEQKPDPDTKPDPEPGPNTDPEPEPGSDPEQPNPDNGNTTGREENNNAPAENPSAAGTTAAPARNGSDSDAPVVFTASADPETADETPAAPVITVEAPVTVAEDTDAAGGDTSPATAAGTTVAEDTGPAAAVGTAAIDGLPRDENGLFYFVLDGSGDPLEARIDVPLADFEGLYFDGEPWTLGTDYETREGSTIVAIAAERLMDFAYGMHEIDARFKEGRRVAFTFDLRGAANSPAPGLPAAPFVIAALALALLIAAALLLRARRAG